MHNELAETHWSRYAVVDTCWSETVHQSYIHTLLVILVV